MLMADDDDVFSRPCAQFMSNGHFYVSRSSMRRSSKEACRHDYHFCDMNYCVGCMKFVMLDVHEVEVAMLKDCNFLGGPESCPGNGVQF